MKIWISTGLVAATITGCAATTPVDMTIAPATAASGYATATSSSADSSESLTTTATLQMIDQNTGTVSQNEVSVVTSATGNSDDYILTYQGVDVAMAWDATESRYSGSHGNLEFWVYPNWQSANGQMSLSWVNQLDHSTTGSEHWGHVVSGFNSDPADVAGRTGSANFTGAGGIYISAEDNSFFASAFGPATLIADFDAMTISGVLDVNENIAYRVGSASIANNTQVAINSTSFTSNTFSTSATISAADLGLQSVGTIGVDGMFYQSGATGVAGSISGVGSTSGGVTTYINGAFAADE